MGSTDKAVITGFICRLCSKMNRFVIHIYGEEGERMKLAEKINAYLPITVKMNDPLPKTACLHCIERLEAHHELMEKIIIARKRLGMESDINQVSSSRPSPTIAVQTAGAAAAAAAAAATPLSSPSLIPSRAPPPTTTIAVNTPPTSLSVDTPSSTSTPLC